MDTPPPPSATHAPEPREDLKKKERRVSRACVSCRQRKTRCDLYTHGTPGQPPCTRCLTERIECTLATSRRGGRRPRKRPGDDTIDDSAIDIDADATLASQVSQSSQPGLHASSTAMQHAQHTKLAQHANAHAHAHAQHAQHAHAHVHKAGRKDPPSPTTGTGTTTATSSQANSRRPSVHRIEGDRIDGDFASRDLLNPSDALNLLAQVADLDGEHPAGQPTRAPPSRAAADRRASPGSRTDSVVPGSHMANIGSDTARSDVPPAPLPYYPPISDGHLSVADAAYLLSHYHDQYHPFFPVADSRVFDGRDIAALADAEPHLLTSIFTVASKDDPAWLRVHEACASHMDTLVSQLIVRGSPSVGAVEALLILAEWVPQRDPLPSASSASAASAAVHRHKAIIGRGEEDQGAWMQIGVAIRLAYLQGLEQTGLLLQEKEKDARAKKVDLDFERKRIAWSACYMSDREVSIRLGKGFWSRGPGPSTVLSSGDFPTLRMQSAGSGDLAQLFQARLEMTQLFSNAHDILYSSTTHREQLFVGGEYVRYIDDFTAVLRKWKLVWGGLSLTPSVKAALILSYEFLRLYINAFAFQATISRAISRARQQPPQSRAAVRPLFADLAGTPDARFIYESIDAANTLLSTLNDFIDPASALRFMPLKYFLYVIYAAVFLFKARVAGALAGDSGSSARRTINVTIERLQKSSANPHSLGQRYARSLYLLWRKPAVDRAGSRVGRARSRAVPHADADHAQGQPNQLNQLNQPDQLDQPDQPEQPDHTHQHDRTASACTAPGSTTAQSQSATAESYLSQHMHATATPANANGQRPNANGPSTPSAHMHHGTVFGSGGTPGHAHHAHSAAATTPGTGTGTGMGGVGVGVGVGMNLGIGIGVNAGLGHAGPGVALDPLKTFSWRDLDGLGQFIGNDMNFLDMTFATPMSDSDHGTASLDTVTDAWQDIVWSGNDVIF